MPEKTSAVIIEEVKCKYLYGMRQDEIAKTTGTSEATVSNIIRELKTKIGQKNVEEIVTLIRALTAKKISHTQIISSARLYNIIELIGLNVEDESISSFLSEIYKESKNNGIEPKTLVETTMRMLKLQPQNITLENLPNHYEELLLQIKSSEKKLVELDKEIAQKEEQKIKAEEDLRMTLQNRETTLDTIEEYHKSKKECEVFGASISDMSKISNMLNQASKKGYNISKIIECTSKEGSFEERQSQLEKNIKQSSEKEQSLKNNIEKIENLIKSKKSHVEDLEKITGRLQNSINIITDLEKQGTNPMQIIQWGKILRLSRIGLQQFEDELQKFSSMTEYIANKKSELQTVENEIADKESRIKTLTSQKIKLESSIDVIQKTIIKCIEETGKKAVNSISNVESSSKKSIISTSDITKKELHEMSNSAQNNLKNIAFTCDNMISQVSKLLVDVGRIDVLRPIFDIMSKSKGDPYEVLPSSILYLQKLKTWLISQKADSSVIRSIDDFIRYLKYEEEKIGIPA